jgi:hypothetical protein
MNKLRGRLINFIFMTYCNKFCGQKIQICILNYKEDTWRESAITVCMCLRLIFRLKQHLMEMVTCLEIKRSSVNTVPCLKGSVPHSRSLWLSVLSITSVHNHIHSYG